ncbi:MAG: type III secretion system cytoplasmic ring protein SctQ [Geminicoccaceae bacterium]
MMDRMEAMPDRVDRSDHGAVRVCPFDPPSISRRHVRLGNALSVRRRPIAIAIGDVAFSFTPAGLQSRQVETGDTGSVALWFSVDGRSIVLQLPLSLYERMLARIDPLLLAADIDREFLPLLLESCVADGLATAEATYQSRIELVAVERDVAIRDTTIDVGGIRVAIDVAIDSQPAGRAALHLAEAEAERIAPHFAAGLKVPADYRDLKVGLSVRSSAIWLSLGELGSLNVGDVLLAEDVAAHRDHVAVTVGEAWMSCAQFTGDGLKLIEPLRRATPKDRDLWMMVDSMHDVDDEDALSKVLDSARKAKGSEAPAAVESGPPEGHLDRAATPPEETTFDDLPIKLVFELGQLEMTLGQLQDIGSGHVFEIGRSIGEAVHVYAGGRRIGQGDIVKIDDQIGVRMVRLFGHV